MRPVAPNYLKNSIYGSLNINCARGSMETQELVKRIIEHIRNRRKDLKEYIDKIDEVMKKGSNVLESPSYSKASALNSSRLELAKFWESFNSIIMGPYEEASDENLTSVIKTSKNINKDIVEILIKLEDAVRRARDILLPKIADMVRNIRYNAAYGGKYVKYKDKVDKYLSYFPKYRREIEELPQEHSGFVRGSMEALQRRINEFEENLLQEKLNDPAKRFSQIKRDIFELRRGIYKVKTIEKPTFLSRIFGVSLGGAENKASMGHVILFLAIVLIIIVVVARIKAAKNNEKYQNNFLWLV